MLAIKTGEIIMDFTDEDDLVNKVVDQIKEKSLGIDNEWDLKRHIIVLDLLEEWLSRPYTFKIHDVNTGYDHSQRSEKVSIPPNFWELDDLSQWLEQSTGHDQPTFISRMGVLAETWEDRLREKLDEMIIDFAYDVLGDLLESHDEDTIPEIKIALEFIPRTQIGDVGIEDYEKSGFLGYVGSLSPKGFISFIPSDVLINYPSLRNDYEKNLLQENLKKNKSDKPIDPKKKI